MDYEIGSFSDNAAILAIAASAIEGGAVEDALPVLRDLRDRMKDEKSRRWLLPEVNRLIDAAEASRVRRHVPQRRGRMPTQTPLVQLEPTLIRIASLASLSATIVRIVVHEVLSIFSPRS